MNRSLLYICLLAALLASCGSRKRALTPADSMPRELKAAGLNVDPLAPGKAEKWLSAVADTYTPWHAMSIDGELSMKGLPIDPSVKIYMEKGQCIRVSLRVPLLGEVGRLEIDPQYTLVVNKRGKCYSRLSTSSLMERTGLGLSDLQDLLLGQVFLAGGTPLTKQSASLFDVSSASGGLYIVTPHTPHPRAEYGFTLYPDGKMALAVAFDSAQTSLLQSQYSYTGKSTQMDLSLEIGSKSYSATLSCSEPNLQPRPLAPIEISSRWKEVSVKELISSF